MTAEQKAAALARKRAWRHLNPLKAAAENARFRAENPGYQLQWSQANRHLAQARTRRYRNNKFGALGSHTEAEWLLIVAEQRGRCNNCGLKAKRLERDHIVPLSLGGSDYAVNIQGLCRSCNASKSNSLKVGTQLSVFDKLTQSAPVGAGG